MGCSLTAFCVKLIYNTESFYVPRGISVCFSGKQKLSPSLFCFACMLACFLYYRTYDCYCRRSVWKHLSINEISFHQGDDIHLHYSRVEGFLDFGAAWSPQPAYTLCMALTCSRANLTALVTSTQVLQSPKKSCVQFWTLQLADKNQ